MLYVKKNKKYNDIKITIVGKIGTKMHTKILTNLEKWLQSLYNKGYYNLS